MNPAVDVRARRPRQACIPPGWLASRRTAAPSARRGRTFSAMALVGLLLLLTGTPAALVGQEDPPRWQSPTWTGHITFLGANAFLGGVTAGVLQKVRGGDFRDGFTGGAAGGALAYGGRRLAVERFYGAGLIGRQVSAVGVSVVSNASEGREHLERLVLPFGPLRLHVDRSAGVTIRPKLAALELATMVGLALRHETEFDWSASVSAGTPVFVSPGRWILGDDQQVNGRQMWGSIIISDMSDLDFETTFGHERVHVLQHDFTFLSWSHPVERRMAEWSEPTRRIHRYVDGGFVFPLLVEGMSWIMNVNYDDRLWEVEARFLEDR